MKKLLFLFYLIFILVFIFENNSAQRLLKISVSKNNQDAHISYIVRKGITYISTKDLSKILSGNYYYNPTAAKIEMKFDNYNLKITARNQFLVLTSKNKRDTKVFQIPISTLLIKNDVFIPAIYALDYVEIAYQKELLFDDKAKHLTITNNNVEIFDKIRRVETKDIYVKTKPRDSKESDYDIYGIEISEMTNGTLIRLNTTRPINKFSSSIHDGTLYLFVTGASFEPDILENVNTAGVVKSLSMKDVKGNRQIEFKLTGGTAIADSMHESSKDIDTDDILITIHNEVFSGMTKNIIENKNHWIFDVIVIDAGHGGKDPGAIGITGAREKDINLGIALELGKIIEKNMSDVKVVQTRKTDKFVELYKRGKIANESQGKLFISIHSNSLGKRKPQIKGFDVYLLRPGKTQKAIEIAEFENSVIKLEDDPNRYQELTDENFILVSMAHSAYMRYSEKFAGMLNENWEKSVDIPARGVKQAGFYVLVGASMPSVLIESGFISNREDEAYLKSKTGQKEIARAIYNTIVEYREYYDEQLSEEI